MAARLIALAILATAIGPADLAAQPRPRTPLPQGNRITVQDGDTIVIEDDARVRIVRRRPAQVRVVFNQAERWVVLLADFATPGAPDGRVDRAYGYRLVTAEWPMEPRWEGAATIEEYAAAAEGVGATRGLGLVTPHGLVQFLSGPLDETFRDPAAIAVLTLGGGGSSTTVASFDEAEQRQIANLRQTIARDGQGGRISTAMAGGFGTATSGLMVETGSGTSATVLSTSPASGAPVRVGGNVRQPAKIVDVPPVMPDVALRAGIRGVVIVEAVVDTDGSVKAARVLRSIPLLDAAAVDAVRQWKYEPTLLNGVPVPVIMTVTVQFP